VTCLLLIDEGHGQAALLLDPAASGGLVIGIAPQKGSCDLVVDCSEWAMRWEQFHCEPASFPGVA
jgi:selenophosphate synthase